MSTPNCVPYEMRYGLFVLSFTLLLVLAPSTSAEQTSWPPVLKKTFPNLTVIDEQGKPHKLKKLAQSKVLFVELGAMPCQASVALAGGHQHGPYHGIKPQAALPDVNSLFEDQTGGVYLDDDDIIYVQILTYNLLMQAPSSADLAAWKKHFKIKTSSSYFVMAATKELRAKVNKMMVPGFYLVDKKFVLRDSTDKRMHTPYLYDKLLPGVAALLDE